MTLRFMTKDYLIIPYGFNQKWDINKINVVGVDNSATYFESEIPCFYLDIHENSPLKIQDINSISVNEVIEDWQLMYSCDEALNNIKTYLIDKCETDKEKRFIEYYFDYINDDYGPQFKALLPVPQAHLYLKDPLTEDRSTFVSDKSNRVDFLFWTGRKLIAVEIDGKGPSHISQSHIEKDRKFAHADIKIIHITNDEIDNIGPKVIERLLTQDIIFWNS
jgi:hypothetical protein